MGLIKLTFDGSLNTAKQDAIFNYFLLNKKNGIFKGIGGEIKARTSNGSIYFDDGFVSIYGRRIYIEHNTSVPILMNQTAYGVVVVKVDTASNGVTIITKEGAGETSPSLIQENLLEVDGVFELPICYYYKTTSTLVLNTIGVEYITTNQEDLTVVKNQMNAAINSKECYIKTDLIMCKSSSGEIHLFDLSSLKGRTDVLVTMYAANNLITFSLRYFAGYSCLYFNYTRAGQFYSGQISYDDSILTIETAIAEHKIERIYVSY